MTLVLGGVILLEPHPPKLGRRAFGRLLVLELGWKLLGGMTSDSTVIGGGANAVGMWPRPRRVILGCFPLSLV